MIDKGSNYDFSTLQWYKGKRHSVEIILRFLNFGFFLRTGDVLYDTLVRLGSSQEPQLSVRHTITRVNSQYSTVGCVISIFGIWCFEFSHHTKSTKCPFLCPASDEKKKALTLEMAFKKTVQL